MTGIAGCWTRLRLVPGQAPGRLARCALTALVAISLLQVAPVSAEVVHRLHLGLGYGPQFRDNESSQHNFVADIYWFFYEHPFGQAQRTRLLLGAGYSYLRTDADINQDVHVATLLPALQFDLVRREHYQLYLMLAAGPSIMSADSLGEQVQGSRFIFNDFIGAGVRFGRDFDWEAAWTWRHLSNADLAKPNPGFDVPFTFSITRRF